MTTITRIKKRDGRIVPFDQNKITEAIWKSAQSVGGTNKELAVKISNQIATVLEVFFKDQNDIPTVEQIQDLVEKILIEAGHAKTAKAYILHRQRQHDLRARKAELLGADLQTKFSLNALKVLHERLLLKDENGNIKETPEQLFLRVAKNIAMADATYFDFNVNETEEKFYDIMFNLDFLPNPPTLTNAGTKVQQLASCFVLPIENSVESIFETLKNTALLHQTGGDTGFNFSKIRPRGDISSSTNNLSSGPIPYIKVFDTATDTIKQAGDRRGANMGILNINHPDILEFINCKERENEIRNFNISVGITNEFMEAVTKNEMYDLIDPCTNEKTNSLHAGSVFELLVTKAWNDGEPGIIFLDQLERSNPTPKTGKITATCPCGEQPLLDNEACALGAINLSRFVKDKEIDWERLKTVVHDSVHFLDNCIDMSECKLPDVKKTVLENRKIGLGVIGFADMLYQLEISYNSDEGTAVAEKIMKFINSESHKASKTLAESRGSFPNFKYSIYPNKGYDKLRNATLTTIAPAETLSLIAETTCGIEPLNTLVYKKHVLDGSELLNVNRNFEKKAKELNILTPDLTRVIYKEGSIKKIPGIPDSLKQIFVVSADIRPEWHIRMQAAFQKYTDNSVAKIISFPAHATMTDVTKAYLLSYKLGCKGAAVYRDKSRRKPVMTHLGKNEIENTLPEDIYIDNQTSLPFNNETRDEHRSIKTNSEEIIPPPIISTV